jgi:glucose-1-phosphate cytidylyltransferase
MIPSVKPPVVLLCGGLGMRIREEAEFKPKAMVEIGGRPILWHIMRHYARFGYSRFIVCLGYRGDSIREYFLNYEYMNHDFTITTAPGARQIVVHTRDDPSEAAGYERGWQVTLAETGQDAMTGARVKRIERYVETDFFLCSYGDGLSNVDIGKLVAFHESHGRASTVTGVSPQSRFGTMLTSGDRVTSFAEKPDLKESLINGGFFVFDRRVFSYLSADASCILEHEPFGALARDGHMMTYRHDGYWQSMDTPRDVKQLNDEWSRGEPGWLRPAGR